MRLAALIVGIVIGWAPHAFAEPHAGRALDAWPMRVDVERTGETYRIEAEVVLPASRAAAWNALTDYDQLADFVPGMVSSRLVDRRARHATVVQRGRAGVWPFEREFGLTLAVDEHEFDSIDLKQTASDSFASFDARYVLATSNGVATSSASSASSAPLSTSNRAIRVTYRATLVPLPEQTPPPFVGLAIMRRQVRTQFEAVAREIMRREGR